MNNNFRKALDFVAKWEGGWSNHPNDRGGKTNYGITEKLYKHYFPTQKIEDCTPEEASAIYRQEFWTPLGCDSMPVALACVVFDSAVQHGPNRARKWLEKTQNTKEYLELRRHFYYDIIERDHTQSVFKKGWLNRLNDLHKYSDILAAEEGKP